MENESGQSRVTVPAAVAVCAYAALVMGMPFIADADPPLAVGTRMRTLCPTPSPSSRYSL